MANATRCQKVLCEASRDDAELTVGATCMLEDRLDPVHDVAFV